MSCHRLPGKLGQPNGNIHRNDRIKVGGSKYHSLTPHYEKWGSADPPDWPPWPPRIGAYVQSWSWSLGSQPAGDVVIWLLAVGCHYFTPDLRLPSQLQSVTAPWPVTNCTAWWQRHMGVNNLPQVVTWQQTDQESWLLITNLMSWPLSHTTDNYCYKCHYC